MEIGLSVLRNPLTQRVSSCIEASSYTWLLSYIMRYRIKLICITLVHKRKSQWFTSQWFDVCQAFHIYSYVRSRIKSTSYWLDHYATWTLFTIDRLEKAPCALNRIRAVVMQNDFDFSDLPSAPNWPASDVERGYGEMEKLVENSFQA